MISTSTENLIENQCQTTAKASNGGDGCISSRVPFQFKLCILLCTFGIVVIYYSMNSANWENVFEKNATFFWHSDQQQFSLPQKEDILTLAEAMNIQEQNDWTKMCAGTVTAKEMDRLFEPKPEKERKYVLANWSWLCGGLGNQMWRFASLYGIGRPYGRRPIYTEDQRCLKDHGPHESEGENEMANLFPVLASHLKYIRLIPEQTIVLDGFTEGCCKYDDPQRRHEIRQIFQFSSNVCSTVKNYAQQLFSNDTAHKVCVHTRIEDFKNFGFESKREFAEKGIEFVHDKLKKKFANTSVVLMGAEKHFLANLTIDRTKFNGVYLPKPMSRGNDLAFATIVCDSLLITASSSTFSWWMGYLLPDDANIFYDSNLDHTPYVRENFLPEWIPIKLENGTIILD